MPSSQCRGKRNAGFRKRISHEADGIEQVWKLRWELNDCPTGQRWIET